MRSTFDELLDDGWGVSGWGPIKERRQSIPKIKKYIQNRHSKGRIVKCFTDQKTGNFIIAHRAKTLKDYYK